MIQVAFILPSFAGGGAERVMITVAGHLDRSRFAARLIVLDGSGPLSGLVPDHVPVSVLDRQRLRSALPALRRALVAEPTDIALSTLGYLNVGLLMLKPMLPRSLHVAVREANMPLSGTGGNLRAVLGTGMRLLYRRADLVISPAQRIADDLVRRFRVPEPRMRVICNPVDVDRLRQQADPPLRHAGAGLRLVAAGRLVEQKGYSRLLDMMPALPSKTHLTILGDGPLRGALSAQADRLGLAGRVDLAGFSQVPWPHYAGADAFVLPSLWEGLPNAVLESLAVGTPVIATPEAGGIGEIAAAATPGAVVVAPAGEPFKAAIARIRPQDQGLRPSLLPGIFAMDQVCRSYEHALADLV